MPVTLENIAKKLINNKFGKLTVKRYVGRNVSNENLWNCVCDCGEKLVRRTSDIVKPNAACSECKRASGPYAEQNKKKLIGMKFFRLTVLEFDGSKGPGKPKWLCKCDCGNTVSVRTQSLISGETKSCGCYARERASLISRTHGLHNHKLYAVWHAIKQRCYNEKSDAYDRYGGRGIEMCEDWKHDFLSFFDWAIARGYKPGLSIDRRDNDGNYEPGNCRWVTQRVQTQNTSLTRISKEDVPKIRSDSRTHKEIALDYGVDESTISRICNRKTWSNIK